MSNREDIIPFLRDRYNEDEELAQEAAHELTGEWRQGTEPDEDGDIYALGGVFNADTGEVVVYDEGHPTHEEAAHIARHDPASVLRSITVKRALFDIHNTLPIDDTAWFLLRVMASEFKDHEDWHADWGLM